jgi:hypothetical protein
MSSKSKLTCSDGMEKACKQLNRYVKSMSTSLQREDQQPGGTTLPNGWVFPNWEDCVAKSFDQIYQ